MYRVLDNLLFEAILDSNLSDDNEEKGIIKLDSLKVSETTKQQEKDNIQAIFGVEPEQDYYETEITWFDKKQKVASAVVDKYLQQDGYRYFWNLIIENDYLGHGLGKQIIEYLKQKFKVGGVSVRNNDTKAINLYRKYGFVSDLTDNSYCYLYFKQNKNAANDNFELIYTPHYKRDFKKIKKAINEVGTRELKKAERILKDKGNLGDELDNEKLNDSDDVLLLGLGDDVWEFHIQGNVLVTYVVKPKTKRVYLVGIGNHKHFGFENFIVMSPFHPKLYEKENDYNAEDFEKYR